MSKIVLASLSVFAYLGLNSLQAYTDNSSNPYQYSQRPSFRYQDSNENQYENYQRDDSGSYYNRSPNDNSYNYQSPQNNLRENRGSFYQSSTGQSYTQSQANRINSSRSQTEYSDEDRNESENKYPQDRGASEADRQLNAKIRDKITGWFTDSYKNIVLNTNNGVVIIRGTVKNNDEIKKLVAEIRRIGGVTMVNADLTVEEPEVSSESSNNYSKYSQDKGTTEVDRQLNTKIRDKITGWFTDSYKYIVLNTNNGVVIIRGTVKSNDEIKKLVAEIRKIDGVRRVNADDLTVSEPETSNRSSNYSTEPETSNRSSNNYSKYSQDKGTTEVDRQLNTKIRDKITGWFTDSYKNIAFNTTNGVVNITGTVKTNNDIKKLVTEIRKIDGVRGVNANLKVAEGERSEKYDQTSTSSSSSNYANSKYPQDTATTEADRQLNTKIRDKITGWFTDHYKNVAINASNGDVYLSGSVKTNDDLTTLLKEIRRVDGVRSVNSDVQVDEQ